MNNRFAKRVQNIQVSAIKQMPLLARAVPEAVSLGQGIPSMPTPQYICDGVIKYLQEDAAIGKYSLQPGVPELKQALADKLNRQYGCQVDVEKELFISVGAMEALATAVMTIVETGDEVIVFDPGYASHIEQVTFAGGTLVYAALQEERGWAVDLEALKQVVSKKTKAIIICQPANPTGHVLSAEELNTIIELAQQYGFYIIADETYQFLVYDDVSCQSLLSFPEIRDQLIVCSSFSKEYAMTGWRVGYMVASEAVLQEALKVHDAFVICAPTISQYAALVAITQQPMVTDSVHNPNIKEMLNERRDIMCRELDKLPELFSYTRPVGSYYILARYHTIELSSWEFAKQLLYEAKVITVPGEAFGPNGQHHIRFSFGGTPNDITTAFQRIANWYQTNKS